MQFKKIIMVLAVFVLYTTKAQACGYYQDECAEMCVSECDFTYIKMGGGIISIGSHGSSGPAIGLGRRFERGSMAIDVSLNGVFWSRSTYFATPKILYLHYFNPHQTASFYAGGGMSYGGIVHKGSHRQFHGILAEGAVGYEWNRHTNLRTFVELDVSQGVLPLSKSHSVMAPGVSLTFGVGF